MWQFIHLSRKYNKTCRVYEIYDYFCRSFILKKLFMELFHKMISGLLGIPERQISNTLRLLDEGATIPFISRYRKEGTGGLDEVQIEQIKEQHDKLCDIAKRKETILSTITEQGKLTTELENVSTTPGTRRNWKISISPTSLNGRHVPKQPARRDWNHLPLS